MSRTRASAPRAGPRGKHDALVDVLQEVSRRLVGLTATALINADASGTADVTLAQYRVLVVLTTRGSLTPSALAEELVVSRPAVARILRNLQARGLVSRRRDRRDGRQAWIDIAPAGARLVQAVISERAVSLRAVVRALSAEERTALNNSLLRMLDVLRPVAVQSSMTTAAG